MLTCCSRLLFQHWTRFLASSFLVVPTGRWQHAPSARLAETNATFIGAFVTAFVVCKPRTWTRIFLLHRPRRASDMFFWVYRTLFLFLEVQLVSGRAESKVVLFCSGQEQWSVLPRQWALFCNAMFIRWWIRFRLSPVLFIGFKAAYCLHVAPSAL